MKSALARGFEFAAIAGILGFAALQFWLGLGDPWREAYAVGAACVGLIGIAAGEFAAAARAAPAPPPSPQTALKEAMDRVLHGLRGYLEENVVYRTDLEGIDRGLAGVTDPILAREAILALREANRRMEDQSVRLNAELETSRREIAHLKETVEEVERLALIDALTQVGNRRFFDRALAADMAECAASGADLCLALADIDRFKSVNDRFGHVVGDHLLKAFAACFTRAAKGRGKTARYGGEEFALLFPGVSFPEARRIVETLRRDIEGKRWVVGPQENPLGAVTASFGLAKLAPGESAESFVHRADARLLRAKALGRNRVVAEDAAAPVAPRRRLSAPMRHAFEAALDAVRLQAEAEPPAPPRIHAPLPPANPALSGSHSLWEMAAEWTPEADPPSPRASAPPPPPPSAAPEDVAIELDLDQLQTRAEVAAARRRFMWENHPDRRADLDRDLANRRVAVANMLLDRALLAIARKAIR